MRLVSSAVVLLVSGFISLSGVAALDPKAVDTLRDRVNDNGAEAIRAERLEKKAENLALLQRLKRDVASRVANDELPLHQAAATFQGFHQTDRHYLDRLRQVYPQATEADLPARDVIAEVEMLLDNQPERQAEVRTRLEYQLSQTDDYSGI